MNNLEQELGCKLLVRSNHDVTLTPEGLRLYTRVAVAFDQLRLGEEEIQKDCSLDMGSVSTSAPVRWSCTCGSPTCLRPRPSLPLPGARPTVR